ncbi:MAG: hypothetical protein AVDCRST_MAG12-3724 [uncultured Rubrobacteraceae bacterium]|uniref:DUF304 domain-containing protein n=1 Tax=uncultured Rubrobacteraceae bacterium TaxID=349277 RepID=A0A6J4TDL4_9ACTN|nr:MAG: hypothetical protein AVDCRST_MAG12-3724 [uncultured Rubrobacteraceae bacterium]
MPSSFMSLPFWIPRGLSVVDGIARVYESDLVLEFEVRESLFRIGTREVVIPFEEIESVALRRRGFLRNVLLFSTRRLHPASSIPGSRAGQFELYVTSEHKNKAREVESLLAYGLARRDLSGMREALSPRRRNLRPDDPT